MTACKNLFATPSRRAVLQGIGVGAAALATPMVARAQSAGTIKIGFVTPATGPLALFGETDGFAVEKIRALLADGLETSTGRYDVEIIVKDGQSDPNRAAEVAGDLTGASPSSGSNTSCMRFWLWQTASWC